MSDRSRFVHTNDGRHRVAYEMALGMWRESNSQNDPKREDSEAFLELVASCTKALAYRDG